MTNRSTASLPRKRYRRAEGVSAVELSVAIAFLVILASGLVEFGLAVYNLYDLSFAVREGARQATVTDGLTAGSTASDSSNIATYVAAQLDSVGAVSNLNVTYTGPEIRGGGVTNSEGDQCAAEVTVSATMDYSFLLWRIFGAGTQTLSANSSMRYVLQKLCY